jgi:ribosomal protein S10
MKKDRQLIKLAGGKHSVEYLSRTLDAPTAQIVKSARRLGISLGGPKPPRAKRGPKPKG